jgi:hypothetical protein
MVFYPPKMRADFIPQLYQNRGGFEKPKFTARLVHHAEAVPAAMLVGEAGQEIAGGHLCLAAAR